MIIGPFASFGTLSDGDRIYSVQEVARDIWECSQRTVRDAIHDSDDPLPAFNVGRGKQRSDYRILESELRAWMRRQQAKSQNRIQEPFSTRNESEIHFGSYVADPNEDSFKARRAARLAKRKK
jgi:hypothetical protein